MSHNDPYLKLRAPGPTPPDEICRCAGEPPIKLMSALGYNPLHGLDCNLEVPPETLALPGGLVEAIDAWRSVHDAIYCLWLDSGAYEAWAEAQLADINSDVNVRGREVAVALNRIRRCYYWTFQDETAEGFRPVSHCPACGKRMATYDGGLFTQRICESCRIVTIGE